MSNLQPRLFRKRTEKYWHDYRRYQTFNNEEELNQTISKIYEIYELTSSMESVLNTLQLNSRTYFGVCWLKVAEIAEQSNVSKRTVQRVLKEFNDEGLVTVHSQIDIKRGGKSANVYVINCMTDSTY